MSEQVTYKGKLKEIYEEIPNLDDKIIKLFELDELALNENEKKDLESAFYYYDFSDEYAILGDKLYKIVNKNEFYDDIFQMSINDKDELEYLVSYYNGGCGFSEALENAYENMKKNKTK